MADGSENLFFSLPECSLAMTRSDSNIDEKLVFGEFFDAVISLSPFPSCPDIESASTPSSPYRIVFDELLCRCLDYPSLNPPTGSFDPLCCDRSGPQSIRLPFLIYPEAYTERLCLSIELALAAGCLETTEEPGVPSGGDTESTLAPSELLLSPLSPTRSPTTQPAAPLPTLTNFENSDSILGLPTVWTILAWIAFAACSLVLLGLLVVFLSSFCRRSGEKSTKEADDRNGNEEHEIEFELEEENSENGKSSDEIERQPETFGFHFADASAEELVVDDDDDAGGDDEYEEESIEDEEDL